MYSEIIHFIDVKFVDCVMEMVVKMENAEHVLFAMELEQQGIYLQQQMGNFSK